MKQKHPHWLKNSLVRVAKIQLALIVIYIAQVIAFDAAKLITPEAVLDRWYAAAGVTVVAVIVWYIARGRATTLNHYKLLTWLLIGSGIIFAAFNVYIQRGMSSRAVLLFVIPIAIATILHSRIALFSTAILSIVAYTTAAIAYFVHNFNEGYKIELYGEILFYSGALLVVSALLWAALKSKQNT